MRKLTEKQMENIDFSSTRAIIRFDSMNKELLEKTFPTASNNEFDELVCGGYCLTDNIDNYNDMINVYTKFDIKVVSMTPNKIRLSVDLDEHDI